MTELEKELEKEFEKKSGGGKAKIGLILCAVLIAFLTFYSIFLYTDLQNQTSPSNDLQAQIGTLQNQLSLLNATHQNYVATHNRSNLEYDSYVASHQYTNSEYENYMANHFFTNDEYESYVTNHLFTNQEYNDYVSEYLYANWEYELARFDFYYVVPAEQRFGVLDLADEIYGYEWLQPYQENVFDCSEMSAYIEWELENRGWNTLIVLGDSPFGGGYHAWVLVETEQGGYMPIETTTMEIIWWDNPYFDNYFIYEYELEDIIDALNYLETDFDWWV